MIKCDGDNVEKILATLVSLVMALARESLYIKKKLDLGSHNSNEDEIHRKPKDTCSRHPLDGRSVTKITLIHNLGIVTIFQPSYNHDCATATITYSPAQLSCDTRRDGAAGGVEAAVVPAP